MGGALPAITSHSAASPFRSAPERFWIPIQTYAADGGARPISGGTPFRQPCPAYPSTIGRKVPQARFSEESFRTCTSIRKRISRELNCRFATHTPARKNHSAQQAWMYSRNQSTIASPAKHRQHVFLHPRNGGKRKPGQVARGKSPTTGKRATCSFWRELLHYKFSNSFKGHAAFSRADRHET